VPFGQEPVVEVLDPMVRRLRRFAWHRESRLNLPGICFGAASVDAPGATAAPALVGGDALGVAFDGELYRPRIDGSDKASRVAEMLQRDGLDALSSAHGSFACAVWDRRSQKLSLGTDRYGTRTLFWTRANGRLLFASEIGALLAVPGVSRAWDEEGLAQFLCFGHYLGDATLYRDIRLVPRATWLTFDPVDGSVVSVAYPAETSAQRLPSSDDEWRALIDERTKAAVNVTSRAEGSLGLSLSGGLDARTILGLLPADTPVTCVSLGTPGSIDHRAAQQLAALAGQPHHAVTLQRDFLGHFERLFREVVDLTDGHYLDQGIVLTTLPIYRDLGIRTLLRGHAGELMHMNKAYAFSIDEEGLNLDSQPAFVAWLWRHLTGYMIGGLDPGVFAGGFAGRMRAMARARLERQAAAWEDVTPVPQRIWRVFVAERLRRETAPSLHLFRNYVETRVPFLDPELVSVLCEAPVHLKVGDGLQTHILKRHRPAFCGVVNANTGAPMSAPAWRARVSYLRMRILGRFGVPGYQPYERLGLWLARDLRPLVRGLLLSDEFLSRGIFDRASISGILEQHDSRRRNHTYLIMALMVLEVSQREVGTA
jgi:asparagine synthetase B (glutamine-hydrolysing)